MNSCLPANSCKSHCVYHEELPLYCCILWTCKPTISFQQPSENNFPLTCDLCLWLKFVLNELGLLFLRYKVGRGGGVVTLLLGVGHVPYWLCCLHTSYTSSYNPPSSSDWSQYCWHSQYLISPNMVMYTITISGWTATNNVPHCTVHSMYCLRSS